MATYLIKNGANQISPNTLVRGSNANSQVNVTWQYNSSNEVQIQSYLTYSVATEAVWDDDISTSAYAHFYIKGRGSSSAAAQSFSVNSSAKNITESTATYKWDISASTSNVALYCRRNVSASGGNAYVYVTDMWLTKDITLTYDANNGSGAPSATTKEEGTTFNLSSTVPTRTGYTFGGWNTKADGTGTNYASGASYTMPTSNVTLYAKWTVKNYNVSISADAGVTITFDGSTYTNTTTTVSKPYGKQCSYSVTAKSGYIIKTASPGTSGTITIPANNNTSISATSQRVGCRIDSGAAWQQYLIYIDNGASWDLYLAYYDNGASWDLLC